MTKFLIPQDLTPSTPQKILASHWHKFLGHHIPDHVKSGFTISNGGGLNASVAVGVAWIQGCYVETDASIVQALTDNSTNHLYLQLTRNGANEPTNWNVVSNTTGTPPTDSMKIGEVITSGGSIGTITDKRRVKADNDTIATKIAKFFGSNLVNFVGLQAPSAQASNVTFTLPAADGSAGSALKTDGAGALAFSAHPAMVLIHSDFTSANQAVTGSPVTIKSFSLPTNTYSKIVVIAWGSMNSVFNAAGDIDTATLIINIGASAGSIGYDVAQATSGQISDTNGRLFLFHSYSAVQQSSASITIQGDHDGTDSANFIVYGFMVLGIL